MSKENKTENKWGLNEEQRNFCDYYLQSRNMRHSYKKAYAVDKGKEMNDNTASVNASKLMKRDNVQQYLKDREESLKLETPMNEEEILLEINKMALDNSFSPTARLKAFELLGKSKAMWIDKSESEGSSDIEINLIGLDTALKEIKEGKQITGEEK